MGTYNSLGQAISLEPISKAINQTYTYQLNNVFYASVNPNYLAYYQRVVRPCAEWLDGYVAGFHDKEQGIFSTRLANALVSGISNQIVGKKLLFKKGSGNTDKKAVDYISHEWSKANNFRQVIKKLTNYYIGLGTSALKLNKTADGEYWLEAFRVDYFIFTESAMGKLNDIKFYIRSWKTTDKEGKNYVLVEHRYFKKEDKRFDKEIAGNRYEFGECVYKPYAKYEVYEYNGTTAQQVEAVDTLKGKSINYKSLPKQVQEQIHKEYNGIIIGEEQKLPFADGELGVRLVRGEEDISSPNSSLGTSILLNIITELATYDLAWSYYVRDMFLGKGTVGIPKSLSQSDLAGMTQMTPISQLGSAMQNIPMQVNNVERINDVYKNMSLPDSYEFIPSLDPEKQKPVVNQFDLREAQWEQTQNNILRRIATKIGLSPKVIASYLSVQQNQKTATEIDSENDTVVEWIDRKRADIEEPVNQILNIITDSKGYVGGVEIVFTTPAFVSRKDNLEFVLTKYNNGFIGIEEAIKEINPDLDEEQLDELVAKATQRQEEIKSQRMNDINGFGEFE